MAWATPDQYFDQLERWLELEGEAERQRDQEPDQDVERLRVH